MESNVKFTLCIVVLFSAYEIVCGDFVCPSPSGKFADETNCRIFYQCEDNHPYRHRCPVGTLYDGEKHECRNRHETIKCGPQPTTEPTITTPDPYAALDCDRNLCSLPHCYCTDTGEDIPGNLSWEETPQIVTITFDGAINQNNFDSYNTIFKGNRTNPNGCPIKGTFFVTHDYSDYRKVSQFYKDGHEMAVASVSRREGLEDGTYEDWVGEMVTMREILHNFAGVNTQDVFGIRAPHLKPGRNIQFEMMSDYDFIYDSSMVVSPGGFPVWPYTLEYKIPHDCKSKSCPTRSFPDLWEFPMNTHYEDTSYEAGYCAYLDQCVLSNLGENQTVRWLISDFERHYLNNKAPYAIPLSVNWFNSPELHRALLRFIDYTLTLPDVYYTTVTEALSWTAQPQPLTAPIETFNCQNKSPPNVNICEEANNCALTFDSSVSDLPRIGGSGRYMATCGICPSVYPWIFDSRGLGRGQRDVYETRVQDEEFQ